MHLQLSGAGGKKSAHVPYRLDSQKNENETKTRRNDKANRATASWDASWVREGGMAMAQLGAAYPRLAHKNGGRQHSKRNDCNGNSIRCRESEN